MEVRPAPALHVRYVQVADPSLAQFADLTAPSVDPVLIAQSLLVGQRHHDGPAGLAVRSPDDRQLDRLARRAREQRSWSGGRIDFRLAVDHRDQVPGMTSPAPWGRSAETVPEGQEDSPGRTRPIRQPSWLGYQIGAEQSDRLAASRPSPSASAT